MKLNWFSPLPPQKTDIAQFTARVINELRSRAEVCLRTSQRRWEIEGACKQFHAIESDWSELNKFDLNVYNIGNNADFHSTIWEVSRVSPGIVILHDYCLQHLFAGYALDVLKSPERYLDLMRRFYGAEGQTAASRFLGGGCNTETMAVEYPLTEAAIEGALAVIVHNRRSYDLICARALCPVACLPLPYAAASERDLSRWRDIARQTVGQQRRLAIFGYIGPNRRILSVLEALARHPAGQRFTLDIYGMVWDPAMIRQVARNYGLQDRVAIHGYVPDLDNRLATADLVINLRFPTMGEASGSQLRIWDHALPSLVTLTGWYETLPPDSVRFVRQEHEIDDLIGHLTDLLEHPERFVALGDRGRAILLEQHDPAKYAEAIIVLAEGALKYRPYAALQQMADRAGGALASWVPHSATGLASDRVTAALMGLFGAAASSAHGGGDRR